MKVWIYHHTLSEWLASKNKWLVAVVEANRCSSGSSPRGGPAWYWHKKTKKKKKKSVGEDVVKTEHLSTVGRNIKWCSHSGKQYGGSSKTENRTTIWSSNSTSGYLSEENKNTNLKRYMHPHDHCSIIYKGQEMQATCVYQQMNR